MSEFSSKPPQPITGNAKKEETPVNKLFTGLLRDRIGQSQNTCLDYQPRGFALVVDQKEGIKHVGGILLDGFPQHAKRPKISEEGIRRFLKSGRIPPFFLQGIQAAALIEFPDEQSGFKQYGRYDQVINMDGTITGAVLLLSQNSPDMLGTLSHEIGHNAHAICGPNMLTDYTKIADDESENNRRTNKPTEVSAYVTPSSREDFNQNKDREDFAETFRLFVMNPGVLKEYFPKRYSFMHDLFLSKMTPQHQSKFNRTHAIQLLKYKLHIT